MDSVQVSLRRLNQNWILILVILLAAWAARVAWLTVDRFHPDEAYMAYWARLIADGQDPWLLSVPVDKPPLFPYLLALCFRIWGPDEWAARLPAMAASIVALALTHRLATRLYGPTAALVALILLAGSPFHILFSRTAFTDPLMLTWGLAALTAAAEGHWWQSGLWLGLAFATKQQGLFFLPLALSLGWSAGQRLDLKALGQCTLGFLLPFAITIAWDQVRWATRPSYFDQAIQNYGRLTLVPAWQIGRRLREWGRLLAMITGSLILNTLVLLPCLRRDRPTALIWLHLLAFSAVHILFSFPVWDRYLLPIVPLVALLGGGSIARLLANRTERTKWGAILLILVLAVVPAIRAAQNGYNLGGDHWAYQGIDRAAEYLREHAAGGILYHHWLGWHWHYYLYDAPIELRWWRSGSHLAHEATRSMDRPQYLVIPGWESLEWVGWNMYIAGLDLQRVSVITRSDGSLAFSIYRITPREQSTQPEVH